VTLVLDAGPLVALADPRDRRRQELAGILASAHDPLILSPLIAAEVDYHLQRLRGRNGNREFIADLAAGRFELPHLSAGDFAEIERLNDRYRDLSPGIADLSIIVLAARYKTRRLLTFDQRHFRVIAPLQGGAFTLLPLDEDIG
jgi:predicted nucleic acid-binding protein